MATWLDNDGLVYLWSKIKALVTANKYVHPAHTPKDSGLYKVTVDNKGHVTAATAVAKSDITALGIPAQDTTYNAATSTASGLMSAGDKAKLDGIASNANNYTHPATHPATMIVQDETHRFVSDTQINNWTALIQKVADLEQKQKAMQAKLETAVFYE